MLTGTRNSPLHQKIQTGFLALSYYAVGNKLCFSPGVKRLERKADHLRLGRRIRMSGAIALILLTPSRRVEGNLPNLHSTSINRQLLLQLQGYQRRHTKFLHLTFRNLASYTQDGRKITLQMPHFIFIQQLSVPNILNMLYNLHFLLFKMPFIS